MRAKTLLNIIPHALTPIIEKGEITPNYYNPGNLFEHVHILSCSDDQPDLKILQKTVGDADLHWHTLPLPQRLIYKSFGYSPLYFKKWAASIKSLAEEIQPDLVRCYGLDFNLFPAMQVKKITGAPVVASLHKHPFQNLGQTPKQRFLDQLTLASIKGQIRKLDVAIGVYDSLKEPLQKLKPRQVDISYNAVHSQFAVKENYEAVEQDNFKLIYVGRLMEGKNPENIIRALGLLPNVTLTIIGTGPLKPALQNTSGELGLASRVHFIDAMDNEQLCAALKDYDVFTLHNDYWGLPKTLLEAALVGLPVIANNVPEDKIPEYKRGFVLTAENTPQAYAEAIEQMAASAALRKNYGLKARETALELWEPEKSEEKYAQIYRSLLKA